MSLQRQYKIEMDHVSFDADFDRKTIGLLQEAAKKKERVNMKQHRLMKIAAAAAALVVFAASAFALAKLVIPQELFRGMEVELESLQAVVDVENADADSVRTMHKTFSNDAFSMTFEAVAKGKALRSVWHFERGNSEQPAHSVDDILNSALNQEPELRTVDSLYAIFTVRRNDGGVVLYAEDGKGLTGADLGYCLLVKGYYPNPNMLFDGTHREIGTYEDGDVLYVACDITNAAAFADEELSIAFTNTMVPTIDILAMTPEGEFYYKDDYKGVPGLYDFDLDDSLADPVRAAELKSYGTFHTYEEFQSLTAEEDAAP